jgi:hypothetical protein
MFLVNVERGGAVRRCSSISEGHLPFPPSLSPDSGERGGSPASRCARLTNRRADPRPPRAPLLRLSFSSSSPLSPEAGERGRGLGGGGKGGQRAREGPPLRHVERNRVHPMRRDPRKTLRMRRSPPTVSGGLRRFLHVTSRPRLVDFADRPELSSRLRPVCARVFALLASGRVTAPAAAVEVVMVSQSDA